VPIEPAATPGVMSAIGGSILATQPAAAAMVPEVASGSWLSRPRAIALAVAAVAAEVLVLSYRRMRRKQQAAAETTGEPIVEPLTPQDR
jgi:hypothetical protein